jgi:hypothetical protein
MAISQLPLSVSQPPYPRALPSSRRNEAANPAEPEESSTTWNEVEKPLERRNGGRGLNDAHSTDPGILYFSVKTSPLART